MREGADRESELAEEGEEPEHRRVRLLKALIVLAAASSLCACNEKARQPERRPGFLDCDSKSDNGDETDTQSDVNHCGRCSTACASVNATTACVKGECTPTCNAGYATCGRATEGCSVDLAKNAENCGTCGNRCFTGYCEAGKCVEPEVLANDVFTYGVVSHDESFVYLNKAGSEPSFWRVPIAGGRPERVPAKPDQKARFIPYLFDGKDYFGCREINEAPPLGNERWGTCELVRGSLEGAPKNVRKLERFALGAMALTSDTLYYATMVANPDSDQGAIHSVALSGGEAKLLIETPEPLSIAVVGEDVFYASGGTRTAENKDAGLFVLRKGEQKPQLLYRGRARSLALDGAHLYFNGADVVMRIAKSGGEPERVAAPPPRWQGGIYGLTVTETHVYYAIRGKDVAFRTLARIRKPK